MTTNKHKGSTFKNFLEEEGLLDDAETTAIKRVLADELKKIMEKNGGLRS